MNSFHLFVDAAVGAPGRTGDNTVLKDCWLMKAIKADREAWLGPQGIIAADGGASDHSDLLLNPYRVPDAYLIMSNVYCMYTLLIRNYNLRINGAVQYTFSHFYVVVYTVYIYLLVNHSSIPRLHRS